MDFRERIAVWEQTRAQAARFVAPPAFKVRWDADAAFRTDRHATTLVEVTNEDSVRAGKRLLDAGHQPLVQILADHRFAGGDVANGSGAQEESLFRRTNLCTTLLQGANLYPVAPDEAILSPGATVFRDAESRKCEHLERPFQLDFIACPGLHNPELVDAGPAGEKQFRPEDCEALRTKVRLMFQAAQANGNDALVLGAMGCGAWRNPPALVARVMRGVIDEARGSVARVVLAILEVDPRDYIVRRRDAPESNYAVFARELGVDSRTTENLSGPTSDGLLAKARALREIYYQRFEFPEWVLDERLWHQFAWGDTVVLCRKGDLQEVRALASAREPCNIGLRRYYYENALQERFGYARGLYKEGSANFAILCTATVKTRSRGFANVKVVNLIGCAQDHPDQPDFKHYDSLPKVREFYRGMWRLALAAAVRSGCKNFRVYNVGGGAFAGAQFIADFEAQVFRHTFVPLMSEFDAKGIRVLGYSAREGFDEARVPHVLDDPSEDVANTLYVNAWDPWSLVGNGNAGDRSLDGAWGSCSNMGVLCWPVTNPHVRYEEVSSNL